MSFNLKIQVTRGIVWVQSSTIVATIINFLIIAILARQLSAHEFGVVGTLLVIMNFIQVFSDFGFSAAIIQKQDLTEEQLSTIFLFNIGIGVLFFLACHFVSSFIALFFNVPALEDYIGVLSVAFIFISLGQMFRALLQKELDFRSLFLLDVFSNLIYALSTIVLIYAGAGIWSIVYGFLFFQAGIIIVALPIHPFRPRLIFNIKNVLELIRFGSYIVGEKFLNYLNRNLDYIIVGRYLGMMLLGYYTLAYTIMLVPISRIAGVLVQVVFPAFSRIQSENEKIKAGYLKLLKCISLLTFPLMAALFIYAHELILVVFGHQWEPAVPIVKILSFLGAVQSIGTTVGTILYAKGRPDIAFRWNIFAVIVYACAFWVGRRWGIIGIAVIYTITSCCLLPIIQYLTNKLIGLNWRDFLNNFYEAMRLTVVLVLAGITHKYIVTVILGWDNSVVLVTGILWSTVFYIIFLYKWNRNLVREVFGGFFSHD